MESAHDLINSLTAATDDVEKNSPQAKQDCYDRLKIALFFDGTGNNRDADDAEKKWSNVARLYDASRRDPGNGIYAYYISGVGTKLNREEPWWRLDKHLRDTSVFGGSSGIGAESRLDSGDINFNDTLKRALQISSEKAGKDVKKIYDQNENEAFEQLNRALSAHRLIKSIEVSVFGFSRGAALARAFVNRILKSCKDNDGKLSYQSYPITFRFLGIFDTVASFGRPANNDFETVDLWLPRHLQNCVHYISANELRYSFPVDLIRQDGLYPEGWKEEVFPGVHSDVGGGYTPQEQGRSDSLARIPLVNMYRESLLNGVRFLDWRRISTDVVLKVKFLIPKATQELFDGYMRSLGIAANSGDIEKRMQAHMKLWYAYKHAVTDTVSSDDKSTSQAAGSYKNKINVLNGQIVEIMQNRTRTQADLDRARKLAEQRDNTQSQLDALNEGKEQIDDGQATIAKEAAALLEKKKKGSPLLSGLVGVSDRYAFESKAEEWMLDAYYGPAPNSDVIEFFEKFVHDSKAGFLGGHEPFAYFRNRGVWESANRAAIPSEYEQQRQAVQNQINARGLDFSSMR